MGYGIHAGDIISLDNHKAGALTMSVDFQNYRNHDGLSPEQMWRSQTAIRSVVGFKVNAMASVPFHLYDMDPDGGRTRVRDGALAKVLYRPGFRLGQARFLEQLHMDMSVYGRWAFTVEDTEDGKGFEFLPLPAHRIALVVDSKGRYSNLAISTKEGWKLRPLDDIVFDISRGPSNGETRRFGYSDLETLTDLALELSGMAQYRRDLFANSAQVPAVIERPKDAGKWSDEAWGRFKSDIATYRAGGGKAGGWPVLEDGMTLKQVQVFDPKSAQYVEVRELHLKEAAQALHIPPELVGATEGTHSNIISLREQLYVDVLGTDIKYFEDAMNAGLERLMKPTQYIESNLDSKLRGTIAERAKINQAATGRPWKTLNETRFSENLPAIEGGDEIITPLNVVEGDQANPLDSAPDDNGQDIKDGKLARKVKAQDPDPKVKFAAVDKAAANMGTACLDWYDGFAKRLGDRMGVFEDPDQGKARKNIALPEKPREPKPQAQPIYKPAPTLEELAQEQSQLADLMFSEAQKVALATGSVIYSSYTGDIVPNFNKTDAWLEKAAATNAAQIMSYYVGSVLTPATFLDQQDWEDTIRYGLFSLGRTMFDTFSTISATEAHSFAAKDTAKQLNLNKKTWWTTSKNPRDSHKAQSGMTIGTDETFPNGQRHPGDWAGGAAEVLNCQCRLDFTGRDPYETTF